MKAPMVGTTVSHYRILEKLGEGGMGVVYKAEDLTLIRIVALKFLPHGLEAHELERARFLQEARSAAILNHPNICTIHEIGESEGQQFIVMEYVDGVTLREKLSEGKLPIRSAVAIAIQIGEALEQAHAKGIVHRDIKAENIMVAGNQVKVMDFGLAKLKGSLKLTKTSSTIGTLAYMAPEHIEGKETDARSDIFSFGVVLYEMLTGHLPFSGEHEASVMYSIVNEEPEPLQKFLPDAPSELVHIMSRALEKDPEDRYQTVRDMVIDLRRLRKESTRVVRLPGREVEAAAVPPEAPPSPPKRRIAVLLAGGAVLVCAAVAYLLLSGGPRLNPAMKSRVLQVPFRNVSYASMSRDGSWIAFPAADERGKFDVYMMNVAQGQPRRITYDSCYHIFSVSLSPDAGTILFSRRRTSPMDPYEVVSISSLGGTGRVVVENGYNQSWMPDGERFGYLREQEVGPGLQAHQWWSSKPDGSDRHLEIVDTTTTMPALRVAYHYSPDGKSIVWTKNFPAGYSEIMIRDRESGTDRQITHDGKFADDALWTETGNIFYSSNRGGNVNIWMIPAGGGEPLQITRGSGPDSPLGLTPDGKRLLYSEVQDIGQVRIARLRDGGGRQLTVDERERGMPSISPSGRYVALPAQEIDAISTARNIYVMDRDGGNVRKLTDDIRYKAAPAWSPDEKWITYSARPGNEPEDSSWVFMVQADNPGQPRSMGRGVYTQWFSETEFVLWGPTGTLTRSIDQSEPVRYAGDSVTAIPVLAGKYVVALDWHTNRAGYYIVSSADYSASGLSRARRLTTGPSWAVFPPGVPEMYYVPLGSRELHRIPLPEGKDTDVRKFPGLGIFYSICHSTGEIAYTETYRKMRFVLVEDVFK
jgi:Tol biopolymer transport system component/predicted Ser/Thr protein kinase